MDESPAESPARRRRWWAVGAGVILLALIGSAAVCPYSEPDWQEGAVAAGWQTVKTIHERAMKA